jgi:SAM-dependent methyltransferase
MISFVNSRSKPKRISFFNSFLSSRKKTSVYHLIPGIPNKLGDEAAPNSNAERYNYDRMSLLIREIDFRNHTVLDIGCNAGWFSFELALQGAKYVVGVDHNSHPEMGGALGIARKRARSNHLNIDYFDFAFSGDNINSFFENSKEKTFDYILLMSTLHHINKSENFMHQIAKYCKVGLIYEHHEFWNEMYDSQGLRIELKGTGHRFGWNEDISWSRKMTSIDHHNDFVINYFKQSEWNEKLSLDSYSSVKFLGFSEKRRPLLLLQH